MCSHRERAASKKSEEALIARLYQEIGHVIRAGELVGKKIMNPASKPNEPSLSLSMLI